MCSLPWNRTHFFPTLIAISCLFVSNETNGQPPAGKPPLFAPDPIAVTRQGPGWRFPQDGWIVVHIEGTPYERGYQHGRLLAREIVD